MNPTIPQRLLALGQNDPDNQAWLDSLPATIRALTDRWGLRLDAPFDSREVSCAWVAPGVDGEGRAVVFKVGMPHMEALHEIQGLAFWDGEPTARLLAGDVALNGMLLERCQPGTVLRSQPEPEQDRIIAGLLRRLWRTPPSPHPFRPLREMTDYWAQAALTRLPAAPDPGLVREGAAIFAELSRPGPGDALLATDLHAGNVLRAQREPWLVIDPKPFIGDPAYDATQHLLNCRERLYREPTQTIHSFADRLGVDAERVRLWLFARAALETPTEGKAALSLARRLA